MPNASPPLRMRGLWLAGGALLVAGLIALCLMPAANVPSIGMSDFVDHAAGYLALTLWFAGLVPRARWLLLALVLTLLGLTLEWLQGALSLGRVADARDAAANTLGIALGLTLALAGLGGWMRWVEARLLRE